MNTIKTSIIALVALTTTATVKAQTADEIISKHTDAIGGKDKLTQVNTLYIEASTEAMGNESPTKIYIVNGKDYRTESDMMGQTMVQVITDKSGWAIMPFGGSSDPAAMPDDQFKASADQVYATDPLVNYAAAGGKVELQGQETRSYPTPGSPPSPDVNAYKIKYTNKFGIETTYFIDPSTWYIIQTVSQGDMMGQPVTITITYSNFQKTDFGIVMPYTANVDMQQFALTMNTKKVEVNKEIDPKIFDMPSK